MQRLTSSLALATLLVGGVLLGGCGTNNGDTTTNTPSSTLGTDSAATKVGGTMSGPAADSVGMGSPTGTATSGTGTTAGTGR